MLLCDVNFEPSSTGNISEHSCNRDIPTTIIRVNTSVPLFYTVREPCAKISIIVVMLQSRKLLFPVSGATGVVVGVHVDFPCVISTVAPNLLYLHRRQTPRRKCNQPRPDLTAQKLSNKLPSFTTHTGSHVIGKLLCVR